MSALSALRFSPPPPGGRVAHDPRLDGLRGFAAASVMMVHAWFESAPGHPVVPSEYLANFHMSHLAVMLFFITSGYVIGLTNTRPFSAPAAWEYLRRRALRIIPIYYIAIAAAWLTYAHTPALQVLCNALFLQNQSLHIEAMPGDLPMWSLHFEVVYYLGFLLVWCYRPRVLVVAIVSVALALNDWFLGGPLALLSGWAVGGLFWLTGLLLAWNRRPGNAGTTASTVSLVLLGYATNQLFPGVVLLRGLGFPYRGNAALYLPDLMLLPVAATVFCDVLGLGFPGQRLVRWVTIALPIGTALILQLMGRLWENVPWTMSAAAILAALALMPFGQARWGEGLFRVFRPMGRISYGIYLFHVPCVAFVSSWYPWGSGWLNYAGAFTLWLALTFAAAWVCEIKLQGALLALYKRRMARGGAA